MPFLILARMSGITQDPIFLDTQSFRTTGTVFFKNFATKNGINEDLFLCYKRIWQTSERNFFSHLSQNGLKGLMTFRF